VNCLFIAFSVLLRTSVTVIALLKLQLVPSVQQKSSGLKFSKSRTGSHVTYVAIVIRVVLLSPYLCIRGVSLSSMH